jgi:hypothetical protein
MIKAILVLTSHSTFSKYKSISQSAKWQRVVVLGEPRMDRLQMAKKSARRSALCSRERDDLFLK